METTNGRVVELTRELLAAAKRDGIQFKGPRTDAAMKSLLAAIETMEESEHEINIEIRLGDAEPFVLLMKSIKALLRQMRDGDVTIYEAAQLLDAAVTAWEISK